MDSLVQEIERVLALQQEAQNSNAHAWGRYRTALVNLFSEHGREILEACRNMELGSKLVAILSYYCGERGDPEGAVETLNRIIMERAAERGSK